MGVFMLGIVIAAVVGGPVSGGLLELDGVLGLEGWQWLFLGQGLPAIAVGFWVLRALPSFPAEAAWLADDEREALTKQLATESAARERESSFTLRDALTDRRILRCALVYFTINFASYGTIFWIADIIERISPDIEGIELGLLAGLPMALGSAGLIVIGRRSDRSGDRRRWVVRGMLLGALGLGATALLPPEAAPADARRLRLRPARGRSRLLGHAHLAAHRPARGGRHRLDQHDRRNRRHLRAGDGRGSQGRRLAGGGLGVLTLVLICGAALASRLPFVAREPALEPRTALRAPACRRRGRCLERRRPRTGPSSGGGRYCPGVRRTPLRCLLRAFPSESDLGYRVGRSAGYVPGAIPS